MSEIYTHRVPQDIIDDLISQIDLVEHVKKFLKLKKQGQDYLALCPFHNESTPSFTVNPAKQFYYCFGCGASGNVMNFIQNYQGRQFLSILQEMADDAGIDLKPYMKSAAIDQLAFKILPALNEARKFFQKTLDSNSKGSDAAKKYLTARGIDLKTISLFSLGYAGYGKQVVESLYEYTDPLVEAGVLDKNEKGEVFSLFRDRIVMPIRDTRGKTIGLSGRVLDQETKPKYRNTKETPHFSKNNVLYGLYESITVKGSEKIDHMLVVEGQFDVMACLINNLASCASMGSSVSAQQLRLLLRYCQRVTFVFDGDAAGKKAMVQVCSLLLEQLTGHEVLFDVAILPSKEDPHSMLSSDSAGFEDLINQATPWMEALLSHLPEASDLSSDKGRSEYASAVVDLAHSTRDPLLRYQLIEKGSVLCKMPCEALNEKLMSFPEKRSGHIKPGSKIISDASLRLARMLWDEPKWSNSIEHPDLWAEEGDELTALLGVWTLQLRQGEFDTHLTQNDVDSISSDPSSEKAINEKRRIKGGQAALSRMLSQMPPEIMENLMRDEPETSSSLAAALAWHITGMCSAKAMQNLSQKASDGHMTDADRERFGKLHLIRKVSIQRARAIKS